MRTVNIHEAKTHLSRLIEQAAGGEPFIIDKAGKPMVKVMRLDAPEVYGSMTNSCNVGTVSCAAWNVLSVDLSTGESTTLEGTPSNGQTFNWAFGGVLEAYYVNRCEDYLPDHRLAFEQVILFDQNLKPVPKVKWTESIGSATPQCHYYLAATYHKVTVWY